jgi:septal ring factor EnvC (AmiA/AmiB activator)
MTKTVDLAKARFKEVEKEIAAQEKVLAKVQDKLRVMPYRSTPEAQKLIKDIQAAKEPLIELANERGDLARMVASASGGKNY